MFSELQLDESSFVVYKNFAHKLLEKQSVI